MPTPDEVLLHQIHPIKLAADISATAISTVLLWQGHNRAGMAVRYTLPAVGSAVALADDVSSLRDTRRGRYVLEHMPPAAQAIRLAGDGIMAFGARRRSVPILVLGATVVVVGWSHGLLSRLPVNDVLERWLPAPPRPDDDGSRQGALDG